MSTWRPCASQVSCLHDEEAGRKAQQLRFQLTSDPLDFVTKVAQVPVSTRSWHVVLAPLVDTDLSLSARIAAALMGGFYTTPLDFLNQDESPRGIMYTKIVFLRGCISRSRGRVAHTVATFESHRCGIRKLFLALPVRTQAVQVFQKDREDNAADC
jgi:hypothetical protein